MGDAPSAGPCSMPIDVQFTMRPTGPPPRNARAMAPSSSATLRTGVP